MRQNAGIGPIFSIVAAIFSIILFAGVITRGSAAGANPCGLSVEVQLLRPTSAPESDAKGTLRVDTDVKLRSYSFEVFATNIDDFVSTELWVEYPLLPGTFLFISLMESDGSGSAEYGVDTGNGDTLPHNARSIDDLAGLQVELRQDGTSILSGTIPSLK